MFKIAGFIARNGVVLLALIGAGYFFFGGKKEEPKPSSPWAVNAPAKVADSSNTSTGIGISSATKASMTDRVLKVADGAAKYAGVGEYTPSALNDQAVGGMNKAEQGLTKASSGQD